MLNADELFLGNALVSILNLHINNGRFIFNYRCQALIESEKAEVIVRSPTYLRVGIKIETTVSWLKIIGNKKFTQKREILKGNE